MLSKNITGALHLFLALIYTLSTNIAVLCTDLYACYKYFGALHLLLALIYMLSTNIAVLCTFGGSEDLYAFYKY